jgi:hypothetical protein
MTEPTPGVKRFANIATGLVIAVAAVVFLALAYKLVEWILSW